MMEFYVSGQSLKFFSPVVAADSLYYLTARFNFTGEDWDGYSKWAHFRQGDRVYDAALDENDEIAESVGLNLTQGQWEIYLTGTKDESRLTTVPVILTVKQSGLVDAPLHEMPLSVAEQVDLKAADALSLARALKAAADNGDFDGRDGTSLAPLGHFQTAQELENIITDPAPGDVYSVGESPPYELYVWDGINLIWRNHGRLQGVPGETGEKGVTFTPSVDMSGRLSWSNDGGLENPAAVNIMGPKGDTGAQGESGPGAYEKAKEAGYTGTEETFYAALTMMPYHNRRHLSDGADPIKVDSGNLQEGSVTRAKLAADVKLLSYTGIIIPDYDWQEDDTFPLYPYRAAIAIEGASEDYLPDVVFAPNTSELAPIARSYEGGVYVYAGSYPQELVCIRSLNLMPSELQSVDSGVFASIAVSAAVGRTLSCTDGTRISTAKTASGRWEFAIPYAGDWTVSDGESTETVSITTQGETVLVAFSTDLSILKDGVLNPDFGTWSSINAGSSSTSAFSGGSINATVNTGNGNSGLLSIANSLSGFRKLRFRASVSEVANGYSFNVGLAAEQITGNSSFEAKLALLKVRTMLTAANSGFAEYEIDISALPEGLYYFTVVAIASFSIDSIELLR